MAEAIRDQNHVTVALGVSSADATVTLPFKIDPVTGRLLTDAAAGGYTNLTQFVDQTPWRLFYSNGAGDVIELALGAAGTVLSSNGAALAPSFTSAGAGDMVLASVQTNSGAKTFLNSTLLLRNPANTFSYTLNAAAIAADRTLNLPLITGTDTLAVLGLSQTFSGTQTFGTLVTTTINGNTFTTGTGTLTIAAGKTLTQNATQTFAGVDGKTITFNNTITFAGTDGTTMTFPTTTATIARTDAAQTFTGVQSMTSPAITTGITAVGATFALINTVSTTVNFAGAATTLNMGAATGTATIANATVTFSNATVLNINGASPSIVTSSTGTASVFNTNALVGNLFGAATTITIGGTPTSAVTHNYSTNATAAATTKTVNIGTGGAASSTTNINLGSANGGTFTVNSLVISLGGTTGVTSTGSIELGHGSDTTISRLGAGQIGVEGVAVPTISSTNTFTNKRITKRTGTTTSSATPTINTDNVDFYSITEQTVDITSFTTNLSGSPTEGQTLWIAITGTGARAITWGASFEASTVALPTTTVTTARLDVGFVWNAATSKWRCVASA